MPQLSGSGMTTKTNEDGAFELRNLLSGNYIVETDAPPADDSHSGPRYSRQGWPGGRDFADATPSPVPAGAVFDFGTISIEKRTLATVTFRIAGDCAGQHYDVRLVQTYAKGGVDRARAQSIACNQTSSFAQVSPGSYGLVSNPVDERDEPSGQTADAWIDVANSDITVDLALRSVPLATIHGRVLSQSKDAAKVSVGFFLGADVRGLVAGMPLAAEYAKVDAAGSFQQQVYIPPGGKVAVRIEGLPGNLCLESLRYDGVAINSDQFVLNEFAMTQDLDIICSDKFGAVTGEIVSKDGGPVNILLVPWPNDGVSYPVDLLEVHGDSDGKFAFSLVRPGHYQALAVRSGDRLKFEAPFRLMSALPGAPDVNVATGSGNSVRIEKPED